jgi:hypothetical protein
LKHRRSAIETKQIQGNKAKKRRRGEVPELKNKKREETKKWILLKKISPAIYKSPVRIKADLLEDDSPIIKKMIQRVDERVAKNKVEYSFPKSKSSGTKKINSVSFINLSS